MELHEALAAKVDTWREAGYPSDVPALAETLEHATEGGDDGAGHLRYLRAAQLRALETYWYLRLVERTPSIPELYTSLYPSTSEQIGRAHV